MSREDVLVAVVAHARELVTKNPVRFTTVDEEWAPQIVKNEYGGYIVMFRKKVEQRSGSAQLTGGHVGVPLDAAGR